MASFLLFFFPSHYPLFSLAFLVVCYTSVTCLRGVVAYYSGLQLSKLNCRRQPGQLPGRGTAGAEQRRVGADLRRQPQGAEDGRPPSAQGPPLHGQTVHGHLLGGTLILQQN